MYTVDPRERTEFVVHYHGGPPAHDRGAEMAREIEAIHLDNGWAGVGYGHMVGQDGVVFEGRGWRLVGAHCPGHNRSGFSAYVAIGGNQQPTRYALASVRALYDEACRLAGRTLVMTWHGAHYATACPGPNLIAWVQAGMPVRPRAESVEDDMPLSDDDVDRIARRTADLITGIGARNPVLVDEGTGAAKLRDGREYDALPTVIGEIQHEQRRQAEEQRKQGEVLSGIAARLDEFGAVTGASETGK
jgi:hypothetical protein